MLSRGASLRASVLRARHVVLNHLQTLPAAGEEREGEGRGWGGDHLLLSVNAHTWPTGRVYFDLT